MNRIRIHYVDDKKDEAEQAKALLESTNKLEVIIEPPAVDIGAIIPPELPDLFLIDYRLDAVQDDGTHANYAGSTLTTLIREEAPEYPIALISKEANINRRKKRELQSDLRVDHFFYRADLAPEPRRVIDELVNLANGFQFLRKIAPHQRDWASLLIALKPPTEETTLLRRAAPPLYADTDPGKSTWRVSELASWIRNTLMAYPGILYDPVFAATELRISVDAFLLQEVQELFKEAKYTGLFAPPEGRWWKERLWRIAVQYVEDTQFADKFAAMFHQRTGKELTPAKSIVRDEEPADAVCYVYHQPVMYKYTVAYRPDNRLPVMDPARVSFKAIQKNEAQIALIEGVSDELLAKIREMKL